MRRSASISTWCSVLCGGGLVLSACGDASSVQHQAGVPDQASPAPEPEPASKPSRRRHRARRPPPEPPYGVHFPAIDPATVATLDVLRRTPSTGEGYTRVSAVIGEELFSARWLALAGGARSFLGESYVVVNEFKRRPEPSGEGGKLVKSVIVDVETGEVRAEVLRGEQVEWAFGHAIALVPGDSRPYYIDPAAGTQVLAIPEGDHGYVYGENYDLHLSHATPTVWIVARDEADVVYLQEWEDRTKPPPMPSNPFPYWPHTFEPDEPFTGQDVDVFTAPKASPFYRKCPRIRMLGPTSWMCYPHEIRLKQSYRDDMSGGWWYSEQQDLFYNDRTGVGWNTTRMCPEGQRVKGEVLRHDPPRYEFQCYAKGVIKAGPIMVWSPPDQIGTLSAEDREYAETYPTQWTGSRPGRFVAYPSRRMPPLNPAGYVLVFNEHAQDFDLIGTDYDCGATLWGPGDDISLMRCGDLEAPPEWFDIIDLRNHTRARFEASFAGASPGGRVVAVQRRGGRDRLVRVALPATPIE